MKNLLTILFICLTGLFAAVNLSLDNVDTAAGTLSVVMENDEVVGGFQFSLDGVNITGVGGGIAEAGEHLFNPLKDLVSEREWQPAGARVELVPAALGSWAGAYGAVYNSLMAG